MVTLFLPLTLGACGPSGPEAVMASAAIVDVRTVPFPSDALLGSDGKAHVSYPLPFSAASDANIHQLAATLSEADGFSTTGSIFFPVSEDVVVDNGATAKLIDLDDPTRAIAYPLFYRHDSKQLVAMAPVGTALAEHHQYGCYISGGVHGVKGGALHPSATMSDAIAGRGRFGAQPSYRKLAAVLVKLMVKPIAATAFTTQTLTGWVPRVLADLDAMPPVAHFSRLFASASELDDLFGGVATTTRPGRPLAGGVRHDAVSSVVEGSFDGPHYLSATPGQLGIFDAGMTVKATDHIPFLLVLPMRSAGLGGVPVVIFQHGIDNDRSAVLEVANDYAARGYATLGIDELWHGSRYPGAVDKVFNLSGAAGSDGIGDPVAAGAVRWFFDFEGDSARGIQPVDPRYIRDNFRQAAIDLMQEVRLARAGDWSEVAQADASLNGLTIDGSHLVYTGESFGAILGAAVLAVDPQLEAAVLDVAGGGMILDLATNSPNFAPLLGPFASSIFDDGTELTMPDTLPVRAQMSLNLVQQVIDPGDGLALAATAAKTKSVLFLFDYADEVVPNQSNEALAAAWGVTQLTLSHGSHAVSYVNLPTARAPYTASPLRALVMLTPASHEQITRQIGTHDFMPPFPPFVKLPSTVSFDNPIEVTHALALGFIDGIRAGAPAVPDATP
jgi:dienelactone hydrolase